MKKIYVCNCETPDKYVELLKLLNRTNIRWWNSNARPLTSRPKNVREARFIYMNLSLGGFQNNVLTWTHGKYYFEEGNTNREPVARVSTHRFVKIAVKYFPRKTSGPYPDKSVKARVTRRNLPRRTNLEELQLILERWKTKDPVVRESVVWMFRMVLNDPRELLLKAFIAQFPQWRTIL